MDFSWKKTPSTKAIHHKYHITTKSFKYQTRRAKHNQLYYVNNEDVGAIIVWYSIVGIIDTTNDYLKLLWRQHAPCSFI